MLFAALCIKDKVGEGLLLGFEAEVIVSDAIPLEVEETEEAAEEEDGQTYSQEAEAHQTKSIKPLFHWL